MTVTINAIYVVLRSFKKDIKVLKDKGENNNKTNSWDNNIRKEYIFIKAIDGTYT